MLDPRRRYRAEKLLEMVGRKGPLEPGGLYTIAVGVVGHAGPSPAIQSREAVRDGREEGSPGPGSLSGSDRGELPPSVRSHQRLGQ